MARARRRFPARQLLSSGVSAQKECGDSYQAPSPDADTTAAVYGQIAGAHYEA